MVVAKRSLLLMLLIGAHLAGATTLLSLDLETLTSSSPVVVHATADASQARWTKDGRRIMTDTVFNVKDAWKGSVGSQITVMQQGGEIGDVGQRVHGTVTFTPGEEVVLFLEPRGDRFMLTGMVQGRFKVENGGARQELENAALFIDPATHQPAMAKSITMSLAALKAKVLAVPNVTPTGPTTPVKVTP